MERLIGRLLRGVRAGDGHLVWNAAEFSGAPETIALRSAAFADGAAMPARHAGAGVGDNVSPPLAWSGVPEGAAELLLIMQDPDAPLPRPVVHLLVTLIPPFWREFPEGALSQPKAVGGTIGRGSFGRVGYAGPRPVLGHGPHHYIFQMFAFSQPLLRLAADRPADLGQVRNAAAGKVIARGRLVGTFERT